jgi:hypothetical protein
MRPTTIQNDRQAVDVEFTLGEIVTGPDLAVACYRAARLFVAALNIGSAGFWWWERPNHDGRFYQRLTDLKAPTGMNLEIRMQAGPTKIECAERHGRTGIPTGCGRGGPNFFML